MKTGIIISALVLSALFSASKLAGQERSTRISFDLFGNPIQLELDQSCIIPYNNSIDEQSIQQFGQTIAGGSSCSLIQSLLAYREQYRLDDWLYYQLVRRTAQQISPKAENYYRYTLYKWFLLTRSGYDATLKTSGNKLLFYVRSDENIYNIPSYIKGGVQYVCLNYHDYGGNIDFQNESFQEVSLVVPGAQNGFSYRIKKLPGFNPADYKEKEIQFSYNENNYHFKVKLNPEIKTLFANYPVVDYAAYFNIPLSEETYRSLIPSLQQHVKGLNTKKGVEYLMHFTRYAFLYERDSEFFGNEKRLTPEQTLLYEKSDCEDRAALFFLLVKEIYDLPMIVLAYPDHVTIAVKFTKPVGKPIMYQGEAYSICEPTPQKNDLPVGHLLPGLSKETYEVVYAYMPNRL